MIKYEMIMWFVLPDLENLQINTQDVNAYKEHYKYINKDWYELREILRDVCCFMSRESKSKEIGWRYFNLSNKRLINSNHLFFT